MSRQTLCFNVDELTLEHSRELLAATGITLQEWLEQLVKADIAAFYAEPGDPETEPF